MPIMHRMIRKLKYNINVQQQTETELLLINVILRVI
jgi:hypothetical protein